MNKHLFLFYKYNYDRQEYNLESTTGYSDWKVREKYFQFYLLTSTKNQM